MGISEQDRLALLSEKSLAEKRFLQHFPEDDDLLVVILKGHLLAEEGLNSLICLTCEDPDFYLSSDFNFSSKLHFARALLGQDFEGIFLTLRALNSVRNDLAHKLEGENLDAKIQKFIQYAENLYGKSFKSVPRKSLTYAVICILGFMDGYELRLKVESELK